MAGLFYKGTMRAGNGLKAAWNFATGNRMLHKRGITPYYDAQIIATAVGAAGGLVVGVPVTAILTGSVAETLAVWAACAAAPAIVTQVPIAFFRAGKHDVQQQQLADQRKEQQLLAGQRRQAALPKPSEPPLI
jgi:hypothetical protein